MSPAPKYSIAVSWCWINTGRAPRAPLLILKQTFRGEISPPPPGSAFSHLSHGSLCRHRSCASLPEILFLNSAHVPLPVSLEWNCCNDGFNSTWLTSKKQLFVLVLPPVYTETSPSSASAAPRWTRQQQDGNEQSPQATKEILQKQALQGKDCSQSWAQPVAFSMPGGTLTVLRYYWCTATEWTEYGDLAPSIQLAIQSMTIWNFNASPSYKGGNLLVELVLRTLLGSRSS